MSWPYMQLIESAPEAPADTDAVRIARQHLENVDAAVHACQVTGMPFYLMCALLEKESMGKNIYGHDVGGVFSERGTKIVTQSNFGEFYRRVVDQGQRSNGVGPLQITYRGFFPQMRQQGLRAWVPAENMIFGARLFMSYYNTRRKEGRSIDESIRRAGVTYNGASAYGDRLLEIARKWRDRVG